MDDDKNHRLSREEFQTGIRDAGVPLEQNEVEEIFSLLDKNQSGTVDLSEFLEALRVSHEPFLQPWPHTRVPQHVVFGRRLSQNVEGGRAVPWAP